MSIYTNKEIATVAAVSGVWTLTLGDVDGLRAGMRVNVAGLPTAQWNVNNVTLTAVDADDLTVTYSQGNATVAEVDVWGQLHLSIVWITAEQVAAQLGIDVNDLSADQLAVLEDATDAAEDVIFRRRREAGYSDHPNVVPGHDVQLGTILYAVALYREQGSVDSFQSFDGAPVTGTVGGTWPTILRLVGCGRPQVA